MKVLSTLCTVLIFMSFAFAEITGRIVVRGRWGDGASEFGLDTSEPPGCGPSVFAVSPTGAIFIADDLNKRIVIYNHDGVLQRVIPIDKYVNTIDVDAHERIYYSHDNGFEIIDCSGQLIATTSQHGRVRLDNDKIYLWRDGISYEYELDEKTHNLRLSRKIEGTLNGAIMMSNGIEFRKGVKSLIESSGIAHIVVNNNPTTIKRLIRGKEEPIMIDPPRDPCVNLADYLIMDGDDKGNVYLLHFGCMFRVDSNGVLTGKFIPKNEDDLHIIYGLPYDASGWIRVKNDRIYYMGATDEEFMIIEYEFQPVGDTVDVENEEDGVKKNIKE